MMKWIRVGVIVCFFVIHTGCCSYRLSGDHGQTKPRKCPGVTFRLRGFDVETKRNMGWLAASAVKKDNLNRALMSTYPDLFSQSSEAVPFDVRVTMTDLKERESIVLYMLSFGILPAKSTFSKTCSVDVDVDRIHDQQERPEALKFQFRLLVTVFSPLGCIVPAEPVGYSGVQRASGGLFSIPKTEDRHAVFVGNVVEGIANAVTHRDQNELNRAALLQKLSAD